MKHKLTMTQDTKTTMNTEITSQPLRIGVLGFGGLGQAAAKVLSGKREMLLVAVADQKGYAYSPVGLKTNIAITTYQDRGSVGYLQSHGNLSNHSIQDLIANAPGVDAYFWLYLTFLMTLSPKLPSNLSLLVGKVCWWMLLNAPVQ
ncbi:hypothetical protein CRD_02519 [Raphidiopsis brookii D9]|nr:hypothetical protein CRD_02519 [Raphidiopsis brookii D9]